MPHFKSGDRAEARRCVGSAICELSTLPASFEDDLAGYAAAGADGISICEGKLVAGPRGRAARGVPRERARGERGRPGGAVDPAAAEVPRAGAARGAHRGDRRRHAPAGAVRAERVRLPERPGRRARRGRGACDRRRGAARARRRVGPARHPGRARADVELRAGGLDARRPRSATRRRSSTRRARTSGSSSTPGTCGTRRRSTTRSRATATASSPCRSTTGASRRGAGATASCRATASIDLGPSSTPSSATGWAGCYDLEVFSDDGTFGHAFEDSLWKLPPRELARRGRASIHGVGTVKQHEREGSMRGSEDGGALAARSGRGRRRCGRRGDDRVGAKSARSRSSSASRPT